MPSMLGVDVVFHLVLHEFIEFMPFHHYGVLVVSYSTTGLLLMVMEVIMIMVVVVDTLYIAPATQSKAEQQSNAIGFQFGINLNDRQTDGHLEGRAYNFHFSVYIPKVVEMTCTFNNMMRDTTKISK